MKKRRILERIDVTTQISKLRDKTERKDSSPSRHRFTISVTFLHGRT